MVALAVPLGLILAATASVPAWADADEIDDVDCRERSREVTVAGADDPVTITHEMCLQTRGDEAEARAHGMVSWEAPDAPEDLFHSFTVEIWLDEGSPTGDTAHGAGDQRQATCDLDLTEGVNTDKSGSMECLTDWLPHDSDYYSGDGMATYNARHDKTGSQSWKFYGSPRD